MLTPTAWKALLCLEDPVVVTGVDVLGQGPAAVVMVDVRLPVRRALRCGVCLRPGQRHDGGRQRLWRAPDVGVTTVRLRARVPRVRCRNKACSQRVSVAAVPWARHGAGHTRAFDDQVAWSVVVSNKTAVKEWFRIAWATVGAIIARVEKDFAAKVDRLAGLRRIGIDEISYRRGHKYLTIVVDHDTGRLVWAAPGRDKATLAGFFTALGAQRCAELTHVSADGAEWINHMVTLRAPQAQLCMDPFHVVKWAGDALDEARRVARREAMAAAAAARKAAAQLDTAIAVGKVPRRPGPRVKAGSQSDRYGSRINDTRVDTLKQARWPLLKNPGDLTYRQRMHLELIARTDPVSFQVYEFKETLRYVFELKGEMGVEALDSWLEKAVGSEIRLVVELGEKISWYRDRIASSLRHRLSNGLVESTNTKLRALARAAFGFHGPAPLIALAFLTRGGARPVLPGRA